MATLKNFINLDHQKHSAEPQTPVYTSTSKSVAYIHHTSGNLNRTPQTNPSNPPCSRRCPPSPFRIHCRNIHHNTPLPRRYSRLLPSLDLQRPNLSLPQQQSHHSPQHRLLPLSRPTTHHPQPIANPKSQVLLKRTLRPPNASRRHRRCLLAPENGHRRCRWRCTS